MEEVILRFGHLCEQIFDSLDNKYLSMCKEVCRSWCYFLDGSKCLNTRLIPIMQRREGKLHQLGVDLKINVSCFKRMKMKAILTALNQINQLCSLWKTVDPCGETPFHIIARNGHLELYKLTIENAEEKNPRDNNGETPLHIAADKGYLEICKLIVNNVIDKNSKQIEGFAPLNSPTLKKRKTCYTKNPKTLSNKTPLHSDATNGQLGTCQSIFDIGEDKNPNDHTRNTPLHLAAKNGHLEVCQLIINNIQDKNPTDLGKKTPLHLAAKNGHLEVCQLIIDNVHEKNPKTISNTTPLHLAATNGYLEIFQLIIDNVQDKKPTDFYGKTPIDYAVENGHLHILKWIQQNM